MQENGKNREQKTAENIFPKAQKPHRMRVLALKVVEKLILYTKPTSLPALRKELENEGYQVHRLTLAKVVKEITDHPTPGYTMVTTTIAHSSPRKTVIAYQLKKYRNEK